MISILALIGILIFYKTSNNIDEKNDIENNLTDIKQYKEKKYEENIKEKTSEDRITYMKPENDSDAENEELLSEIKIKKIDIDNANIDSDKAFSFGENKEIKMEITIDDK
jgi:sortase (surface protein transpeptidase)